MLATSGAFSCQNYSLLLFKSFSRKSFEKASTFGGIRGKKGSAAASD